MASDRFPSATITASDPRIRPRDPSHRRPVFPPRRHPTQLPPCAVLIRAHVARLGRRRAAPQAALRRPQGLFAALPRRCAPRRGSSPAAVGTRRPALPAPLRPPLPVAPLSDGLTPGLLPVPLARSCHRLEDSTPLFPLSASSPGRQPLPSPRGPLPFSCSHRTTVTAYPQRRHPPIRAIPRRAKLSSKHQRGWPGLVGGQEEEEEKAGPRQWLGPARWSPARSGGPRVGCPAPR